MIYFDDIQVGDSFETDAYTMTEAEIIDYGRQFDPQPFHTDPEAAKRTMFGGLIASGWHTAAVMMRLQVGAFVNRMASRGSPGFDELRWLKPVRPSDTIRARLTVAEKSPSRSRPDIGSVRYATEVINQRGEVVMTLTQIGICDRRPGGNKQQ
jgi:acyl dehydratase